MIKNLETNFSNNWILKSSIGMKGTNENKNIIDGNIAKKNLKASEDALVVNEFFWTPSIKKDITSYIGNPSNPGIATLFDTFKGVWTSLVASIFCKIVFKLNGFKA